MFTLVPALFLFLLAALLSLWSFGALVAMLVLMQRPLREDVGIKLTVDERILTHDRDDVFPAFACVLNFEVADL